MGSLSSEEGAGLAIPKVRVFAAGIDQACVRAVLDDLAVVQYHDAIERGHGGKTVCHHDGRAPLHEVRQRILHERLAFGVERAGSFVQYKDRCVGQNGARDRDTLALATGEFDAALPHHRVEAVGQLLDEFERVRLFRSSNDLFAGCIGFAVEVFSRMLRLKEQRLLRHIGDLAAQALLRTLRDILAIDEHFALLNIGKAQQELVSVVLPEPDWPTRPMRWPPGMWRFKSVNTGVAFAESS